MLRMIARGLPDEALTRHLTNGELSRLGRQVLEAEAHTRGLVHEVHESADYPTLEAAVADLVARGLLAG